MKAVPLMTSMDGVLPALIAMVTMLHGPTVDMVTLMVTAATIHSTTVVTTTMSVLTRPPAMLGVPPLCTRIPMIITHTNTVTPLTWELIQAPPPKHSVVMTVFQ